ncbi:TAXI family TRAP transporter solute-binding subunit [Xenorhabdus sp. KK7.4]|uniref:TAXI family TRAP transporter solute-binding subunit n=1 Tax=Xenorhabdus sp. KK7.4 TaxID=1851572 RepID=UPI000C04AE60|nr:TAXI family TRAP transporter solute-binding subunit [Xenorhabdus sp. KK7.4]PHM48713.1 C4-dicarboxylate ABC transporter substrate-binding protein [Xenorhabdus sp. KK7.4]
MSVTKILTPKRTKALLAVIAAIALIFMAIIGKMKNADKRFLSVATASTGGTFYPIGVGLANVWSHHLKDENIQVTGQSSAGSIENIDLLQKNEAQLVILQSLIAVEAYQGVRNFENRPYQDLRSISVLWPNVEHFVMMDDKIKEGTLNDIANTRFSVGPQASGTEQSTLIILQGVNLSKKSISPEYLGYSDTVSAMRDGRLDGGAIPAGVPASAVTDMYASGVSARILNVTDQQLKQINAIANSWFRFVIQPETYPRQSETVHTIAQPNILMTTREIDEQIVYELTKSMFENLKEVHQIHSAAKYISPENALKGVAVPLHPGAYRYYREIGLPIPDDLIPPEIHAATAQPQ